MNLFFIGLAKRTIGVADILASSVMKAVKEGNTSTVRRARKVGRKGAEGAGWSLRTRTLRLAGAIPQGTMKQQEPHHHGCSGDQDVGSVDILITLCLVFNRMPESQPLHLLFHLCASILQIANI